MENQHEKNAKEFFHLRNDYVFKRIFKTENTTTLMFLVNSIVAHPVKSLILINDESLAEEVDDKRIYQDIRSKDENGNFYNMEMQNSSITAIEENRFLFTGCKNIGGQLFAGNGYDMIKNSETIIFTNSHYDEQLKVTYEMHDPEVHRSMINQKIIIHIISVPVVKKILKKMKTGEALEDLEFLCTLIEGGFNPMICKKASEEQRKIYKVMENSYHLLYGNPTEVTNAEQAFFYQKSLEYRREMGKEEGKRELLMEVLVYKFGTLSKKAVNVLKKATPAAIESLSKKFYYLNDEEELLEFLVHLSENMQD